MTHGRERLYFWVLFSTGLGGLVLSTFTLILIHTH